MAEWQEAGSNWSVSWIAEGYDRREFGNRFHIGLGRAWNITGKAHAVSVLIGRREIPVIGKIGYLVDPKSVKNPSFQEGAGWACIGIAVSSQCANHKSWARGGSRAETDGIGIEIIAQINVISAQVNILTE